MVPIHYTLITPSTHFPYDLERRDRNVKESKFYFVIFYTEKTIST